MKAKDIDFAMEPLLTDTIHIEKSERMLMFRGIALLCSELAQLVSLFREKMEKEK